MILNKIFILTTAEPFEALQSFKFWVVFNNLI